MLYNTFCQETKPFALNRDYTFEIIEKFKRMLRQKRCWGFRQSFRVADDFCVLGDLDPSQTLLLHCNWLYFQCYEAWGLFINIFKSQNWGTREWNTNTKRDECLLHNWLQSAKSGLNRCGVHIRCCHCMILTCASIFATAIHEILNKWTIIMTWWKINYGKIFWVIVNKSVKMRLRIFNFFRKHLKFKFNIDKNISFFWCIF